MGAMYIFFFVVASRNYSSDDYTDEDVDCDDEVGDKDFVPYSSDETGIIRNINSKYAIQFQLCSALYEFHFQFSESEVKWLISTIPVVQLHCLSGLILFCSSHSQLRLTEVII